MRFLRKTGLWLARRAWINRAIAENADLEVFKHRPSARLFIGLGVLALSMLLGWPAVAALGAIGIYLEKPLIALVGGPVIYGISWVIYGLAFLIAGKDLLKYAKALNRWTARKLVQAMVGDHSIPVNETNAKVDEKDESKPIPEKTPDKASSPIGGDK